LAIQLSVTVIVLPTVDSVVFGSTPVLLSLICVPWDTAGQPPLGAGGGVVVGGAVVGGAVVGGAVVGGAVVGGAVVGGAVVGGGGAGVVVPSLGTKVTSTQ
jgi:hypothetical protein